MDKDKKQQELEKTLEIDEKEPEKVLTEEESQMDYTDKQQKEFFDKDDEIEEINWD